MSQNNHNSTFFLPATVVNRRVIKRLLFSFISVFPNMFNIHKNHDPILLIKRFGLMFYLLFFVFFEVFSQSYSSKNNYTGAWETPDSWNPLWSVPQTDVIGHPITINGYITANSSLSFSGSSKLDIIDTLVIKGNLSINDNNDLKIYDNGILIVWGNLTISDETKLEVKGYLIITGDIIKEGEINHGKLYSNDNPVKVFIGGTIPSGLTNNNSDYPALNCTNPPTTPYPNSTCSYGNMTDILNDPINSFFESTCIIATPTVTADGPITFCAGGSVTLTSSAGSTYLWSTGATTQSINVTTSGNYTVRVTNVIGCLSVPSAATVVTVNALPVTPTITAGGPTAFCDGGSVSLTSSAGASYLWSNASTSQSINVTTTGSYIVQITNASGCQSAASVVTIVTVNALPATPTITANGPTTFCAGDSVTLISSAGTGYLWSNAATTPNINITTSGSYTVQVTDANGCQSATSAATEVNINALPVVNAGTDATIPNGTSTTIDATVTGTGPFTYSWSPSAQLINALIEDPTTVNLAATTVFTLTASSTSTSCSSTGEVEITISGGVLSSNPTATPGIICAGADIQLYSMASGGSGSYTYNWTSTPIGFTSTIANPIANPTVNTTYNVAVFDGFTTVNSQVVVTVNAIPAIPTITASGPTTFCAGDSVTLSSSAGSTYLWSTGATTDSINVTTSGNYTVRVTNASGCQSLPSANTLVTVNALPVTPTITAESPTTFCDGDSVTLTSGTGTSYGWSNASTTQSINVTTAGSYTVQVTNASGCQSAASVATIVTVNALPVAPTIIADGPTTFCAGGSVTLTSSAGTGYLWSNTATTQSINVTTDGSYIVQVTDANGCQSAASAATLVTINALPVTPTITANGTTTFCEGDSVTLTSSEGTSYWWSNASTTQSINVTTADSYIVQVTNANGCQSAASAATIVTVNALPVTPIITANGPTTFCDDDSVTLTSSAETGYLWSNASTTQSINVTTAGSYTVQVINASGCHSAASVATIVIVNALPIPVINITDNSGIADNDGIICFGETAILTASGGASYSWSSGETTSEIIKDTAGTYTVTVTDTNGCQNTDDIAVIVNALPIPVISITDNSGIADNDGIICFGETAILTASGGTSYSWSSGETTSEIIKGTAGTYIVTVTDVNGCQNTDDIMVIVNTLPIPLISITDNSGIAENDGIICDGETATFTASGGISFSWSSGETIPEITKNTAGTYTVKVTDANGCSNTANKSLIITTKPEAVAGTGGDVCGQDYTLNATSNSGTGKWTVTSGTGNVTFSPDENDPSATIEINAYGSYQFTWTVVNENCPASSDVIVTFHHIPVANAGIDQKLNNAFTTKMEAELLSTETGEWSLLSGSGFINDINSPVAVVSDLSAGENIFLWTVSSESCTASDSIIIEVNDLFVPQVITPNGDLKNDFFVINDIEKNGPAELIIFNRWGNEVYNNTNYMNDWDGRSNNGTELSNDTYFYVLKFGDGKIAKGFVVIKR